jgi:tRNA-dihydrouridine synthase B
MSFSIGPWRIEARTVLAPMAGVTDRPFRILCRRFGAGLAASEMITADQRLWHTTKTRQRMNHEGEPEPRVVQLAGNDPALLADAARANVDLGAQIIDINMGCPAKKVYGRLCGSALLGDEPLVGRILENVARAVDVPVTVKIRTGIDRAHVNGLQISRIAAQSGIRAIAVHGRTRADFYEGEAEYETIRAICAEAGIPVIANGDELPLRNHARTRAHRLFRQPERSSSRPPVRPRAARSRRAAVPHRARLRRAATRARRRCILGINRGTLRKKLREFGLSA